MNEMDCRIGCGACCIAPSISSPLPGMSNGKPAGVRCVNLSQEGRCQVWGTPEYPEVCRRFRPDAAVCGETREEALTLLAALEQATRP
jgi:uncharacterized protein